MSHAIGRLGESFLLPNQICAVLSPLILQRIIVGDASYQQVDSRVRILQDIALIFLVIPPPFFWSLVISWWNNNCQFMGIVSLRAWGMTIKQFPLFKAHFFGGKCPLLSLNLADILQRWLVGRSVGRLFEPFFDQTKQALCQRAAFYNESYSSQSSWFMVSEYYRITL